MDDFFCRQQLRTHPYTLFCWILMILVKSTLQEILSPIVPSIEPIYSNESFNFNVLMVRRFLKDDVNEPQVIINRVFSSPFYDNDEQPNDNLDGLSHISFDSKRNDIPNYSDDIVFNQSTGDSSHEFVLFNYTDPSSPLWPSIPPFSPSPASSSSSNNETVFTLTPLETVYQYNWFYLFLGLLVFVGVFGNILVCLAIILERRLQNATNYFLLSLAIADLLVSILVMPMSIVNEVYGYWPFGTLTCNLWVTCDVLCCSSSIYHMCFISVGRYIGIKNPLHARQARLLVSRRAVLFKIVIVWLIAALITSPITILGVIDNTNVMPEPQVCCINNNYFIIIGAFSAFYLPMIIMVNSYVLTVRLLRRKAKFCKNSSDHGKWPPSRTSTSERSHGDHGDHGDDGRYSGNEKYHRREFDSKEPKSGFNTKTRSLHSISDGNGDFPRRSNTNHSGTKRLSATSSILRGHFGAEVRTKANKRYNTQPMMIRTLGSSVQVRTEQKATQVLGLVFFLFIICWSPFFTRNLVEALFTDFQMPSSLPTIFLWLGYFSSTINPVIYTIFNRNFRRAFRRIILCQTIKYRLQRSQQSFTPNQRLGARRVISRNSKNNNNNNNSSNSNNNNNNNNNNNHNNGDNSNNNVMNFHDYVYRRPGRIKRSGRMLDQTRESYDDSIDGDGRARHSEVLMRSQSNPIESGDPRHNHGSHSDDFGNYTDQLTMAYYWQFQSSAVSENQI